MAPKANNKKKVNQNVKNKMKVNQNVKNKMKVNQNAKNKMKVNQTDKRKKIRRPNHKGNVANFNKVYKADDVLAAVAGIKKGNRSQFVKGIWDYIKKNKLQTPEDGRVIIPDAKLAKLMGNKGKKVNAFTMMKFIELHLKKN